MDLYSRPAAQFVSLNPVVPHGVLWQEEETGLVKRGSGTNRWNDLDYWDSGGATVSEEALAVADGGTGAITASAARVNLGLGIAVWAGEEGDLPAEPRDAATLYFTIANA